MNEGVRSCGVVAVGGAIGSVARYFVSTIQSPAVDRFPYAIFIVNISGGFLMGVLTELMALKFSVSPEVRAFLTTGILGGYTTFSTFSLESAMLIERHAYAIGDQLCHRLGAAVHRRAVLRPLDRARDLCLSCAPSTQTMTASAWTAGSSGIIPRHPCAAGKAAAQGRGAAGRQARQGGRPARRGPDDAPAAAGDPCQGQALGKAAGQAKHPLATKDMGSLADRILYMDKQVIVLDKPPGLATQGGSGLTRHVDGMLDQLQYEKPTRPKLVHRLDRDTSGVLLIARTALAASGLSASLALRDASKVYWALTRGVPKQKHGVIKARAGQGRRHGRMAATNAWHGRARTKRRQIRPHRICRDGDGGHRIRLGGGAAHHRAHPPDPRASGQPGHADRRRFQIWRRGFARARRYRRQAASACPFASTSAGPMAGGCRSPRRCRRIWSKAGSCWASIPTTSAIPFRRRSQEEEMKRFYKDVQRRAGRGRLCRPAGRQAGQDPRPQHAAAADRSPRRGHCRRNGRRRVKRSSPPPCRCCGWPIR